LSVPAAGKGRLWDDNDDPRRLEYMGVGEVFVEEECEMTDLFMDLSKSAFKALASD